jgi:hypothetical protein
VCVYNNALAQLTNTSIKTLARANALRMRPALINLEKITTGAQKIAVANAFPTLSYVFRIASPTLSGRLQIANVHALFRIARPDSISTTLHVNVHAIRKSAQSTTILIIIHAAVSAWSL